MATQSKAVIAAELAVEHKTAWLNYEVMAAQTLGQAVKIGQFTEDGIKVQVWLINPLRAHGGVVQIGQTMADGHTSFSVAYLEEEYGVRSRMDCYSKFLFQWRELIGKAMVARDTALRNTPGTAMASAPPRDRRTEVWP